MRIGTLREWQTWFVDGKHGWRYFVWWLVLATAGVAWLWLRRPVHQDGVRQLGIFYEFVGVGIIVWDIRGRGKEHRIPFVLSRALSYLRRAPVSFHRNASVILGSLNARAEGASLAAAGSVTDLAKATTEQKVEYLLEVAKRLDAQIASVQNQQNAEVAARQVAIAKESNAREQAVVKLQADIKATATGGLDLNLFGVSWAAIGAIGTNATPEVCRWFLHCLA